MLRMADSTVVANLPPGMDAYAGYVSGNWPTFGSLPPAAHHLSITPTPGVGANCADLEKGDWTLAQAPQALAIGCWCLYTSVANVVALRAIVPQGGYKLWTAHWNGVAHICGPRTCGACPVTADGTQWQSLPGYDLSLLRTDFFGPMATRTPSGTPGKETDMLIVTYPNGAAYVIAWGKNCGLTSGAELQALKDAGVGVANMPTQADADALVQKLTS